jgi:glucose-6-phosphate dehydrogenase assembly protein OpcA
MGDAGEDCFKSTLGRICDRGFFMLLESSFFSPLKSASRFAFVHFCFCALFTSHLISLFMTTTSLIPLEKPQDVSLREIETQLNALWNSQSGDLSTTATRAATFSMVIYEPEEFQQLLAVLGFYSGPIDGTHGGQTKAAVEKAQQAYDLMMTGRVDPQTLARLRAEVAKLPPDRLKVSNLDLRGANLSDAIAARNPRRVVTLSPTFGEDTGITSEVTTYCPLQKSNNDHLICSEYINLRGTKEAFNRVGDTVASLLVSDLPKFLWWKATPNPEHELFKRLLEASQCIIMDSSFFSEPESEFLKIQDLVDSGISVADLNWHRLLPWQELTAETFDPPERRVYVSEIDRVVIDYEKGNTAQALMFLGWLASRLGWEPTEFVEMKDDYDLRHIKFQGTHDREIKAELAAIPTADTGEILGDLIGLRLASTNPSANCGTILCSETTGCMRLEAGGAAQAGGYTEMVKAINDQKAEFLLSQQLQRWGREVLFEESLAVIVKMLRLRG